MEYYWTQIKEIDRQIEEIKVRPIPAETKPVNYSEVRRFLKFISRNWQTYSLNLRNQFLKLIIEKVEIRGQYEIEAIIFWKNGFKQKVSIHRPPSNSKLDRRWTAEEDKLLGILYQPSSADTLMVALPGRSWKATVLRARRLTLRRNRGANKWKPWSNKDDKKLILYCERGIKIEEIANKLGRSTAAIAERIWVKGLSKPLSNEERTINWETSDLLPSQQSPWRGGERG